MHVFALDTLNSNLLFGISSVAVLVAEHQIKRYSIVKKSYLSHIQLDFLVLPLLSLKRVGSGVGFHGIFTMYFLFGASHNEI